MYKSVGRLISILYRKNQIYLNMSFKKYNITSAEHSILLYLYHHNGSSQEDLCSFIVIDKSSIARSIKSLIKKGYLTKQKNNEDKRYNKIYITEKALEIQEGIYEEMKNWNTFLTEGLEEESKQIMYNALENMVKKVEQTDFKEKWGENHENNE